MEFFGVNVTVNQTPERVRKYIAAQQPPFRTLYDEEGVSTRAYAAPTTSYIVIIDRAGKVAYTGTGANQDLAAALRAVTAHDQPFVREDRAMSLRAIAAAAVVLSVIAVPRLQAQAPRRIPAAGPPTAVMVSGPDVGRRAPTFRLPWANKDGVGPADQPYDLALDRGKTVVLAFYPARLHQRVHRRDAHLRRAV